MSRTEGRRPLRVLSAAEIAQLQQAQTPRGAAQVAVLQSADRFRRTLSGSPRRGDAPPSSPSSPSASAPVQRREGPGAASARTTGVRPERARGAEALPELPTLPGIPHGDDALGVDRVAALELSASACAEQAGAEAPPDAARVNGGAATVDVAQDPWPEQMAQTIAALCARAAPSFVNWTVTLPMDPQVLPETDLRLSLSQHWLSLRFITQSVHSHHLVSTHRHKLLEQLERLPQLPHGIDIEVT
ncbi:type III secretion HpaP family protein [Hydrogenophaga taeniospiralis]|uniref:type III secretion HpaP family protein n=1 Tax=Hydrogenophaga taeniospiralis TaxID=65656 RepID=UPI0009FEFCE9|nr:type III secretion HpaP family protein [Hydrogenophaga taeniospiralis]